MINKPTKRKRFAPSLPPLPPPPPNPPEPSPPPPSPLSKRAAAKLALANAGKTVIDSIKRTKDELAASAPPASPPAPFAPPAPSRWRSAPFARVVPEAWVPRLEALERRVRARISGLNPTQRNAAVAVVGICVFAFLCVCVSLCRRKCCCASQRQPRYRSLHRSSRAANYAASDDDDFFDRSDEGEALNGNSHLAKFDDRARQHRRPTRAHGGRVVTLDDDSDGYEAEADGEEKINF